MLDDDEQRMAQGRDWQPMETYFEEDLVVVDRILSERNVVVDPSDTGILAMAAGALAFDRRERLKHIDTSAFMGQPSAATAKKEAAAAAAAAAKASDDAQMADAAAEKPAEAPAAAAAVDTTEAQLAAALEVDEDGPATDGKPRRKCILVKWKGLPYSESTWEWTDDLKDDAQLTRFRKQNILPSAAEQAMRKRDDSPAGKDKRPDPFANEEEFKASAAHHTESKAFKGGRKLRDYQLQGENWLIWNWYQRQNSILADEMGLGKTVQTVAILDHLVNNENVHGPFLVIAPLSTLGHWKREFDEWSDLHCVYYHDPSQGDASRALIRKHEWQYPGRAGLRLARQGIFKVNVVLTSYHVLLMDWEYFQSIKWRYVVVDEAHALKNRESQLQWALQEMHIDSMLLLTGTPLQNDTAELWSLLKLVKPEKFGDREEFVEQYGDLRSKEQVAQLQLELETVMLRRVKEDVEKSIPPKEETIVSVELTQLQKQYYRAIFERNRAFLSRGAGNMPPSSLISIEMELRKCCNHPFLLRNTELRETALCTNMTERVAAMVSCSGKMVLLDKLLPRLKADGHRLLIFSQFKMMLGLLEDLLKERG